MLETDNIPYRLALSMSDTAILVIERSGIMVVSFQKGFLRSNNTHYFSFCQVFWLIFYPKFLIRSQSAYCKGMEFV